MAENTIDNLSIQVVASADRAISTFNRLASGASGLRGAARGAADGMQDMAQGARDAGSATQQAGTQSGKARPNINGVGKDAKDAGENAKKGSSGLATFWQSLKRIAYYRMIRSIIKSIGQAFREGAQNLYQWSAANPSLSDFAKNMNRIATSVTYLKNSLGAMLEPIVRILTPIIEWVIDKLVWLIDKINQFFAALSGAETYTAAKKVAQTWGDTSQQVANNTHKAAEEIKRTILGFDEINKLDKPNSSSYGGDSGLPSASAAAQDMFEERPLEGWAKTISDFIRKIKDFFDGIFGPIRQLFTDAGNAFDDLNRSIDAARQEDKTVNINVKINTTAEKLWNDFVDEWNAIKDKILFFKISPTPPVDLLWNQIKNAWDSVDHTLGFLIETASSANGHWKYFKNDWDKEDRTVGFLIKTASSANGHWDVFKKAWDKEDRTVGFLIKTASSAKGHWDNFKKDWDNLESNTVGFLIKTASSANGHWNVFKKEWDAGDRKVGFTIKTASTADGHWSVFKKAWDAGDRIVGFIIKTASSANGHWNVFKKEWTDSDRTVYVDIELRKKGWTTVSTFVDDSFGGATGGGGKTSGGGAGRTYGVDTKLNTPTDATLKDWWNATTTYWGKLLQAGGVAGMMVALKEPGEDGMQTLATKIGEAWDALLQANKLTYGVIIQPVANKAGQVLSSMGNKIGSWLFGSNETPHTDIALDATPGSGFKETLGKNKFALGGIEDASVLVSLQPDWLGTPEAELGVDNLQGTVTMSLGKEKDWANKGWQKVLGLKDKTAKITTSLKKVKDWKEKGLKEYLGISDKSTTITAKLDKKWGNQKPLDYLGLSGLTAVIKTKLKKERNNAVSYKIKAGGGTGKGVVAYELMRRGGVFSNGRWSDIPQYANGTLNAGTIFAAGEAGPEVVGHVGGRTEVLNKSQLASAMFSAVQAAMAPAAANFASAAQSMGVTDAGVDMETLSEMIRHGVEQAMARSNDYDRQKVALLQQINEKDYNPEISTSSINKAQQRMNRRAGTTIVPVGT
jgi:hypothetical protein